jgi:imidazole glycerol-phosphate synthase subunit HisH
MDAIVVDAGTGNLHSVLNALSSLGFKTRLSADPDDLAAPGRIILPGVGAFGSYMGGLEGRGLHQALVAAARRGDPFLGICVGMQALFEDSHELGLFPGLGLLGGHVLRLSPKDGLKVPHTGWNQVWPQRSSALLEGIEPGAYAYFNHAYFCNPADFTDILAVTDYGAPFASVIEHGSLAAVQFHPEKSQAVGLRLLENFMRL